MSLLERLGYNSSKELRGKRGEKYKKICKGNGTIAYLGFGIPIHFWSEQGKGENPDVDEWEDIECKLDLVETDADYGTHYLSSKNKYSVGFRNDGLLDKAIGIREFQNDDVQYEMTPYYIEIDGEEIELPELVTINKLSNSEIEHIISGDITLYTMINQIRVRSEVKVNKPISKFKITYILDLKEFIVASPFEYDDDGNKIYQLNNDNDFEFVKQDDDNYKIYLGKPKIFNEGGELKEFTSHSLIEVDGVCYYTKESNIETIKFTSTHKYPFYIDFDEYWGTTADGRIANTNSSSWAACIAETDGDNITAAASTTVDALQESKTTEGKGTVWQINRSFLYFDTSGIDSEYTIKVGYLYLCPYTNNDVNGVLQKGTQASTLTTADYDSFTGNTCTASSFSFTIFQYMSVMLNDDGNDAVVKGGTTKFCVRPLHDYTSSEPTVGTIDRTGLYFSDNTGTTYDPYLYIEAFPSEGESEVGCDEPGDIDISGEVYGNELNIQTNSNMETYMEVECS